MLLFSQQKLSRIDLVTSDCYDCGDVYGDGYFQRCLCVLATFCVCAQHCHTLVFSLISGDVDHWCKQPTDGVTSTATWRNVAIPLDVNGRPSRCTVYRFPGDPNNTEIVGCDEWDYDPEQRRKTIVSRWDLVCQRKPLRSLAQAIYIAGSLAFMSVGGHVADRIGRMPVLLSTVALLQLTTLGGCFAGSYAVYTLSRFFNGGCAATAMMLAWTILFEVSTHKNRSRYLCAAMCVGVLTTEVWFTVDRQLRQVDWIFLQIFMLLPTLLTLYAFTAAHEPGRWYVAKKDMVRAEIAMMKAAKVNKYQLSETACMLERIKAEVVSTSTRATAATKDSTEAKEVQRRAFVMFGSSFAVTFTIYSILILEAKVMSGSGAWLEWTCIAIEFACFTLLYVAFLKIATPRLLVASIATLGGMACVVSLSIAVGYKPYIVTLFVFAKPLAYTVIIVINISVFGMVPTPVRCGTICWLFGFGRLGAVCGILLSIQRDVGRGDILFALAGTALFVMLFAHLSLRRASEQPTLSSPLSNVGSVQYMVQTLDPLSHKKEKKRKRVKAPAQQTPLKSQSSVQ